MTEQWDRGTGFTQQWHRSSKSGALAASEASDYIDIGSVPSAGVVMGVAARAETANQIAPRLMVHFYHADTGQGLVSADSGAEFVPYVGAVVLSPLKAHKINSMSQTQRAVTNEYVWVVDEECSIPFEITNGDGKLYMVVENIGGEAVSECLVDVLINPRVSVE